MRLLGRRKPQSTSLRPRVRRVQHVRRARLPRLTVSQARRIAIAAQGLLRLGRYLDRKGDKRGAKYWQAGLTVADTVLGEPYLSTDPNHQGLILHSIYHRPNGWDYIPSGSKIPRGESSMWGDYHARELALYLQRIIENKPYYTFFGGIK